LEHNIHIPTFQMTAFLSLLIITIDRFEICYVSACISCGILWWNFFWRNLFLHL